MNNKTNIFFYMSLARVTLGFFLLLNVNDVHSQLLSHFSWNTNPVTQADYGPNGTIKSGSPAISSPASFNGTNGLNPNEVGTSGPTVGVDLDLDVSDGSFDTPGIDISIAFQREEGEGYFVTRGNDFNMGMRSGRYFVEFSLQDGSGGSIKVESGNIFNIPDDDVFRVYRFVYNQNTGLAEASVDGSVVWTYSASVGDEMYWSHPTIRIGDLMDAAGNSVAVFDELTILGVLNEPGYPDALPVEWLDFSCSESINGIDLHWSTATETNNSHFEVERSIDGQSYETISAELSGAGNSSFENHYDYLDKKPASSLNYYRIKQVDFDGQFEYSDVISCAYSKAVDAIKLYPNPAVDLVTVSTSIDESVVVIDASGKPVYQAQLVANEKHTIQVSGFPRGVYFVKTTHNTKKLILQ